MTNFMSKVPTTYESKSLTELKGSTPHPITRKKTVQESGNSKFVTLLKYIFL